MMGRQRRYNLDETCFQGMTCPEQWYWVGFLLGDGCVFVSQRRWRHYSWVEWRMQVRLRQADADHLDLLRQALGYSGPLRTDAKANAVVLAVHSRRLCERLIELGVTPDKTNQGHSMPAIFPSRFTAAFARGFFDANGSISRARQNTYALRFSGQPRFMRWLEDELRHRTGASNACRYPQGQHCAQLCYGRRDDVARIARWLYGTPGPALMRKRRVLAPLLEAAA